MTDSSKEGGNLLPIMQSFSERVFVAEKFLTVTFSYFLCGSRSASAVQAE